MTIKFLKNGIRYNGKYIPCWYSGGQLINYPKGTITIYAREYGNQLPSELKPKNETDFQTDYFDTDKARIVPGSKYYKEVLKMLNAREEKIEKRVSAAQELKNYQAGNW